MMRLHLRHRDDDFRRKHRARKPQLAEAAVVCLQWNSENLIPVQVHELNFGFLENVCNTGGVHHQLGVPLVSWAFADYDAASAQPKETTRRRTDQSRIRVDGAGEILYKIGLKQDRLPAYVDREQ